MAGRTRDEFLRCYNCVNWGQPWKLGKRVVLCEQEQDDEGERYFSSHAACEFFVPLQGALPRHIQHIRLLVQSLSSTEQFIFKWALDQQEALLDMTDKAGEPLSLGDCVTFQWGGIAHVGFIEAANERANTIKIFCPAFPQSNISLVSQTLTKISPAEAHEKALSLMSDFQQNTAEWHKECIADQIADLRSKKNLSPKEWQDLIDYERRWAELDSTVRYQQALKSQPQG